MSRLENDPFLTELTKLYERTKKSGSVYVTMKSIPCTVTVSKPKAGSASSKAKEEDPGQLCLLRARAGKDKISTVLKPKDIVRFQLAIATIFRAHMDALKKKEKRKKKVKARLQ